MGRFAWDKPFFKDREEAARLLAEKLSEYRGQNPLILAIPRGAIYMGQTIAEALQGELDVVLVHKIGAPDNPEFAMGAVSEEGETYLAPYAESLHYSEATIQKEAKRQVEALQQRRKLYTPYRKAHDLDKRVVIIVDDGIATGSTVMAAIRQARHQGPLKVIVATAAVPPEVLETLGHEADRVVALAVSSDFGAVGEFFENFSQVTDEEVIRVLKGQAQTQKLQ